MPAGNPLYKPANSGVDKYRSANEAAIPTISLPAFSGRRARSIIACSTAPEEMPTGSPSTAAHRRAAAKDSASDTVRTSSSNERSSTFGVNPAPIPWMRCGPGAVARQHRAFLRLHADDLQARPPRLQRAADPGQRAARADAADDEIHQPVGVRPDFLGRRRLMRRRIGRVVELPGDPGALGAAQDGVRPGDRARHPQLRRSRLHLRAQQPQQLAPLDRGAFRHHHDQLVALRRGHEGQRDAGIARCRLDDRRLARRDLPRQFGRLYHRQADTVLHRAERVEELQLERDVGVQILGRLQPRQLHQRSPAHQVQHAVEHMPARRHLPVRQRRRCELRGRIGQLQRSARSRHVRSRNSTAR